MSIDIKNLQKVINLCRKTGVLELEVEGVRIKLSPEAIRKVSKIKDEEIKNEPSYTEEDTLFWSSGMPGGFN